jgi:hypothetical protein
MLARRHLALPRLGCCFVPIDVAAHLGLRDQLGDSL